MKKLLYGFIGAMLVCGSGYAMDDDFSLSSDTSDPLYMLETEHLLSTSKIEYGDDILRLGQAFAYGMNNRLNVHANVHYQFDFDRGRKHRGFSSIELGGAYRAGLPEDNSANMSTDVLFGARFAGNRHVREPAFARSTYFAGLRIGRQWNGVSLAGTLKSTWIFGDKVGDESPNNDNLRGMSFIDLIPEVYFRMVEDWRFGIGFNARFATDPDYDREWWKVKLIKQFGRTQYGAMYSYEYEENQSTVGMFVNILF